MERETGFEPATSTLARSHSTTELFPPKLKLRYHRAARRFNNSGRLPSVGREGAPDDLDGRRGTPGREDADDVESDRPMLALMYGKIEPRHGDDAPLLPPGDCLGRNAAPGIATRLHLNKDHRVAVGRDNVNFANSGAIAPGKNCVPAALERPAREIFADYSEVDSPNGTHRTTRLQSPRRSAGSRHTVRRALFRASRI